MPGRRVTIIGGGVMGLMTGICGRPLSDGKVFAGVRWRGAGDKSAPWAGRVLAQLALQQSTGDDIRRFAPARFAGGREASGLKAGGAVS